MGKNAMKVLESSSPEEFENILNPVDLKSNQLQHVSFAIVAVLMLNERKFSAVLEHR